MDLEGKGKDNLNARRDLEKRGIRKAMHPQKLSSGKFYLPPACFSMDNGEKTMMCNLLKKVKVLDGYASNISRCVNVKKRTISGLKSHDNHILMDQLLPIGRLQWRMLLSGGGYLIHHLDGIPLGSIVSSSSEGITSARWRGPTLMHASWNKDKEKMKILLNGNGQPIMSETGPVATQMGVMARDGSLLPLHYNDWRDVPPHYKRRVWEEIKAHTTADDSVERWYMQSLGKKWQGWKSEAKKQGYKPYDNDANRLAHRPNRVTEEQWRCLAKSATNQSIRNSQTLISTSGRTSHARVVQQEKDSGKNPTRLDTFVKTHTRKDGTNLNEETSAILDKLKELQQPSQDGSNTTPISEDEIFIQAIGPERPERKRGCGLGVTSTQQLAAKK
ncbi:hypothetical protein Vadar_026622 [Vaccinium darrowii]|uniref:Uncharacterized protein n=1 Tax=Vaccinium darrowii TaxID=229202 RepID=A0ACB7XD11_9ERIC|nr:hypothetical protein Vadar_026622 [Vaccinium darrowii]